jgi:hypothetical protein
MENSKGVYELWGLRRDYFQRHIGGSFDPEDTRERVATFSSLELAEAYIRASELNKEKNAFFNIQRGHYRFRKGSLLRYYDDYEIESFEPSDVPHNPRMEKR